MVKRYLHVCEFSDGKGVKEEKRWTPEWGGIWGPKSCGNRPSGPSYPESRGPTGSGVCTEGEQPCLTIDLSGKEFWCSVTAIVWGVQ